MSRLILPCLFSTMVTLVVVACSGSTLPVAEDGCAGAAPSCFGADLSKCCGQDPSGQATCQAGQWKCGSAGAPGCNGTSCIQVSGSDGGSGAGSCIGTAPNCFGNDDTKCCGQDPAGPATCVGGAWKCGTAAAPGCNGTSCLLQGGDAGATGCSPPCGANQVCISEQTVGGGQPFPDDAGNCPVGTVHAGDRCAPPPTYACGPFPTGCGSSASLNCTCAASACTGNYACSTTGPGLVNCVFGAP